MTETQENNFFATQINQAQNQQEKQEEKSNLKHQKQQEQQIQVNTAQNQKENQYSLKKLLEAFNSYDKTEKGVITLDQCKKILQSFEKLGKLAEEKIEIYHKLSLPISQNLCTFDEFLFVFGLHQFNIEGKNIDQQYEYSKAADRRIIDFLILLNNYRKKCQRQSSYQQAKKSKKKIQQIRQKQYARRKNFLNLIHKKQLEELQQKQKQKFAQFCQTWDEFMNEYQITAAQLIKKLSERQEEQLKEFILTTKQQLGSKVRFSKQFVDLADYQKRLVKAQQYQKADRIRIQIQQLKIIQLQKKQKQDISKVQLRAQTVKKQQTAAMNTLLQKIQKDRNDQSRQRMSDSEKLIVKNKTLITDVNHKHTQCLKKLYQALHNISIDEARLISTAQSYERARSTYASGTKSRI